MSAQHTQAHRMKIIQTPLQRANTLLMLEKYWPSVPEGRIYPGLTNWSKETPCGAVCCFGAWCTYVPEFQAQGVRRNKHGAPIILWGGRADLTLFGFGYLFTPRGWFDSDKGFTGSDHALVTRRLKWLIENSEVQAVA